MSYIKEFTYAEKADMALAAKKLLQHLGLTGPQMDLLRRAARPWSDSYNKVAHDGQVSNYGVMEKTLQSLRDGGFIALEYQFSEEARSRMEEEAHKSIHEAHDIFDCDDPLREVGETTAWDAVLTELRFARKKLDARDTKVTRITTKGREAVAEFLGALGIVED